MRTRNLAIVLVLCLGLVGPAGAVGDSPQPRETKGHLIGHAHIDLSWLWTWEETVHDIAVNTFQGVLAQMEKNKGLTFAQSQPAVYEAVEKDYPDLFAAIKAKVKQGTWAPVGGMWAEPDLNMPDGEALVRQLLYGKRYFRDKFGFDVTVGWNPDSFGHNAQLPQILKKAGIDYYVFQRCAPAKKPIFWWEGLDGSRVLAAVPPGWYNLELKDGVRDNILVAASETPARDFLVLYGEGDHGGGPRDNDLLAIEKLSKDQNQPLLEFATPQSYFKRISGLNLEFPVVQGELNFTFPACYTTQAATKKNNRRAESLLLTAEKFSGAAMFAGFRDYYPERDIDQAWKIVLRNQFHDILDGSSISPVYDEAAAAYAEAFARGRRALEFSLETIANEIDTRGEGRPIVVFNPLFWDRADVVETELSFPPDGGGLNFKLLDPQGRVVPHQILSRAAAGEGTVVRFIFIAEGVPSFGYKVFRAVPGEVPPERALALNASAESLENEFLKVRLDPKTGWLLSLVDKPNGREILSGPGNVLEAVVDEPKSMSAWQLGLKETIGRVGESGARVELVEQGPVRAMIRVSSPFRNSRFVQEVMLYRGLPRLDCRLTADWQERNIMIKAAFPAAVKNSLASFEIPFGAVSRPTDGVEVPALRWIDLSDESGRCGLSLLNDCKYGFDVKDNVLRMSVVHGATNPDPEADRGRHELLYALYPHQGSWQEAQTVQRGYELNTPLIGRPCLVHAGSLPAQSSFVRVRSQPGVIVSAMKKEYGYFNRGLVLRAYEVFGKKAELALDLAWPVRTAETNLIDYSLEKLDPVGKTLSLTFEPHEIKTVKLFHSRREAS